MLMKSFSFYFYLCAILCAFVFMSESSFAAKDPDLEAMKKAAESQKWETVVEKAQAVHPRVSPYA